MPVTVCAAAICTARFTEEGPSERVLVGISDRMLTADGDVEFEPRTSKITYFPLKRVAEDMRLPMIACLSCDDSDLGFELARDTYSAAQENETELTTREVAYLYSQKFASLRRKRAERLHLAPFNLDSESFISQQKGMSAQFVMDRADQLARETLAVEALIVGVDEDGPHIYHVFDPGQVVCRDRSAFWAIGLGKRHFETQFMALGYDQLWPLHETTLLMYSAKRKAELAPGVGRKTDMFTITSKGFAPARRRNLEAIEEHYDDFEKAVQKCRSETAAKMLADLRVWGPEPAKTTGEQIQDQALPQ